MRERLPSSVEASALVRSVLTAGGFAAIVRKGDADRGELVLIIRSRGEHVACLERNLQVDGQYRWQRVGPAPGSDAQTLNDWAEKRARFDEDLWLIDLDVADAERFIAETSS